MSAPNNVLRAEIVRLFKTGLSYGQIGRKLGVGRSTVGGHLARWRASEVEAEHTRRQPSRVIEDAESARQVRADRQFVRALALAFLRGDHLPRTGNSDAPQERKTVPGKAGRKTVNRAQTGVSFST